LLPFNPRRRLARNRRHPHRSRPHRRPQRRRRRLKGSCSLTRSGSQLSGSRSYSLKEGDHVSVQLQLKIVERVKATCERIHITIRSGRINQTTRVTHAMEAGVTDHVWSIAEMVGLPVVLPCTPLGGFATSAAVHVFWVALLVSSPLFYIRSPFPAKPEEE
jgi:hypothetical protein